MCDNNGVLIVFIVLKAIILFVVPILIFVMYKKNSRLFTIVGIIELVCIIAMILLRLFGNDCIKNSNITYIKGNNDNTIYENSYNSDSSIYSEEAYSIGSIETTNDNNVYVYNINTLPLKTTTIMCDKKRYINNYGNSITGITILMSNAFDSDFDENEVFQRLANSQAINCDNGVNFEAVFNELARLYGFRIREISYSEMDRYILNGHSVLAATINEPDEEYNFGCGRDYIVVYNKSNDGYYNIINPNDKTYSYFCPSDTIGYGSIIDKNQNNNNYTFEEINSKTIGYFVIEVE